MPPTPRQSDREGHQGLVLSGLAADCLGNECAEAGPQKSLALQMAPKLAIGVLRNRTHDERAGGDAWQGRYDSGRVSHTAHPAIPLLISETKKYNPMMSSQQLSRTFSEIRIHTTKRQKGR